MYVVWFLLSSCICGYLVYLVQVKNAFNQDKTSDGPDTSGSSLPEFRTFQKTFLTVYYLCVGADWIQGPYLYKLYAYYGFNKGEIGFLFLAGYLSSAVLGTGTFFTNL
mmetsp:Transcript_27438/g.33534  ORF Transcript_27438/g.33534 Transcript_27438/m.33534 type:complete len:108 (-) Transcript_27438:21-344(-)